MFDIDFEKILVFGVIALVVIPAKDLPRVLRTVGQTIGKMRRMANEFRGQFMDALNEADLEGVKKEISAINDSAKVDLPKFDTSMGPVAAAKNLEEVKPVEAAPEPTIGGSILPPSAAPFEAEAALKPSAGT